MNSYWWWQQYQEKAQLIWFLCWSSHSPRPYSKKMIYCSIHYLIQNSPAVKKKCAAPKRPLWKKIWNPRWRPRNGCDGRLMAKILITTIQVNLCCLLHVSLGFGTKFTWIVVIKNFAISLLLQPFLGRHLGFHIFFPNDLFGATHFFYSWAVLDQISLLFVIACCVASILLSLNICYYLCFLLSIGTKLIFSIAELSNG